MHFIVRHRQLVYLLQDLRLFNLAQCVIHIYQDHHRQKNLDHFLSIHMLSIYREEVLRVERVVARELEYAAVKRVAP